MREPNGPLYHSENQFTPACPGWEWVRTSADLVGPPVMHPKLLGCIQLSMNAMERTYTELLDEYRVALGLWSEVRAHYSPDEPEVAAAASHLEAIEQELASFSQPALAA
jgi:hypothetical protein